MRISRNATRSRFVLGLPTPVGLKVFCQAAESWHETLVPTPTSYSIWYRLGLDGANHIHVLVNASGGTVNYADYPE